MILESIVNDNVLSSVSIFSFLKRSSKFSKYKSFLSKIGILEKIDFDIEEVGKPIKFNWGKCPLATASFGHGITTTLLQLAKAYSIVVNVGYTIKPKLVKNKNDEKKEKISSDFFLVRSNLIIKQEKISIDYLLHLKDNTWKIFDVLLDGSVSEVATKKSEFRIYIKEKKIDELIEALKKFNNQIPS